MSKIHYFQRFSSKENTVTNNTLQLIARIYNHSPNIASEFLNELTAEEISIGLTIAQQPIQSQSIPDGIVSQSSFKILIEAKVQAPTNDVDQLLRHCKGFRSEENQILLFLTVQQIPVARLQFIKAEIAKIDPQITFKNVTYRAICDACAGLYGDHEPQMKALVEDYIEYCNDSELFDQSSDLLRIVPCGKSLLLNEEYAMYFHPSNKGYTKHRFEGIYSQREVKFLIDIKHVFDVTLLNGEVNKVFVEGTFTAEYDEKIKSMSRDAKIKCGYDIDKDHRFFCGIIAPTSYKKKSPNGIQGARFINLEKVVGSVAHLGVDEVAKKLIGLTWGEGVNR